MTTATRCCSQTAHLATKSWRFSGRSLLAGLTISTAATSRRAACCRRPAPQTRPGPAGQLPSRRWPAVPPRPRAWSRQPRHRQLLHPHRPRGRPPRVDLADRRESGLAGIIGGHVDLEGCALVHAGLGPEASWQPSVQVLHHHGRPGMVQTLPRGYVVYRWAEVVPQRHGRLSVSLAHSPSYPTKITGKASSSHTRRSRRLITQEIVFPSASRGHAVPGDSS